MEINYLDTFIETLDREALTQIQLKKFQRVCEFLLKTNEFYKKKLGEAGIKSRYKTKFF